MQKPNIKVRRYGKFSLAGFGDIDPLPTLKLASHKLSKFDYHVSAGTALGIYRDDGFIAHDTDLDFAVLVESDISDEIIEAMKGFELVYKVFDDNKVHQVVFVDKGNKRCLVDVELYYIDDTHMTHYKPEGIIKLKKYQSFEHKFKDMAVRLPYPIEDYLTERYGEWKTPAKAKGDWKDYTKCFTPWEAEKVEGLTVMSMPVDVSACGHYRVRQPLKGLEAHCKDKCHVIDNAKDDKVEVAQALAKTDIIFLRPGAEVAMQSLRQIKGMENMKAKWVMDIDDNVDELSPYSVFYKDHGIEDYKNIWKDGDNGFDIQRNIKKNESLKWGLANADMVTVTTEKLGEFAKQFNDNVYVNDNVINTDHWYRLNNKQNKTLRVVWQGSPSHFEDWMAIKEPMQKLMDEFDFEVIMLGSNYKGIFKKEHLHRVKSLPWVAFEAHSYRMMSLQADIGIIPLADLPFNWYKSSIKWYENAAMGLPSVVSNVLPYSESIEDGKTALAYNTSDEFYEQMKRMIVNKGLRANIANSAYNWVMKNKTLKQESQRLHDRLVKLVEDK